MTNRGARLPLATAAAKERLKALAGGAGGEAVDVSDGSAKAVMPSVPASGAPNYEAAAALEEAQVRVARPIAGVCFFRTAAPPLTERPDRPAWQATVGQLRSKLAHSESERDRDKHKLQRTVDAAQLKRREYAAICRDLPRSPAISRDLP